MASTGKPRIRKAAPTIRERAETAQSKAEIKKTQKPSRVRSIVSSSASPVKNLRLPQNKLGVVLGKFGRAIAKILGWLIPKYFVNSWREVRQVTWPSRKETWRLTLAVFIFATVFGALVAGVDMGLDEVFKKLVLK